MSSIETFGPIPGTEITTMYARCGPHMGVFPQCPRCRELQGDSDDPVFCASLFPIVQWAYPADGEHDDRN